ncbi:MAG: hypothetical protein ED559_04825 [Phycisphaera sp.]|nr:MAG: hypothetical protein ED559_04825 [Phycisphaera sp.]
MRIASLVCIAAVSSVLVSDAQAQQLVGPTDAWYGINNLEVTYSGGTALFNVRFDRRSFNDVFGEGTPDLPLSSVEDIGAAYSVIADYFNSNQIRQTQLRPIIPVAGTPDVVDNLFLPINYTDDTINGVINVDDGGPTGWMFNPDFDLFKTYTIDRDQAFAGPDKEDDAVWAVFSLASVSTGSLIGDSIDWTVDSGPLGGGTGSVVVVDPGLEVDVETITFVTNRRADLRARSFTLDTLTQSLTVPATTWTFDDLDFTDRQVISGVSQSSGGVIDSLTFTEDSITVQLPEVSGNTSYNFDIQLETVSELTKDEIQWTFDAGILGGTSGVAVIDDEIEASYTAPSPFPVHSHADFTANTLTIAYDPAGLSTFQPSVWTFTDLDWLSDSGQRVDLGDVVQTSGTPVNSIIVTGSSITIDVPELGAGELMFTIHPVQPCLADVNGDGLLTPTDFTAWINAFNNSLPECDQNGDGSCTPTDFTAWIANFNAGC